VQSWFYGTDFACQLLYSVNGDLIYFIQSKEKSGTTNTINSILSGESLHFI
jgi:hypothetical protein